jgi:hypothetical protein
MTDLLEIAIEAHGGWKRWSEIRQLRAHLAVGGVVWHVKGWPDVYADIHVSVDTQRQHVEYTPFLKPGQRGIYEPDRTTVVASNGAIEEQRESPRAAFAGHTLTTRWDAHHLLYFSGYAMWTYLTTPFLFKLPGFKLEELAPWDEDGEAWRRLKVTFPPHVPSHSTEQVFYFDRSGLLRRHDYSVEIMGGTASAHYATDPKVIGGLVFPTKRRVYSKGPDNRPLRDRVAVAVDLLSVDVE